MNLRIAHRLCIILLSSLFLYACTKEDLSDCDLQLLLNYDYHIEDEGFTDADFIAYIDFVELYVFDQQNKFISSRKVDVSEIIDNKIIEVPYEYKDKILVAWARQEGSYELPTLKVGDDIENLTLNLITEKNTSSNKLAHLFHGGRETMTFTDNGGVTTQIVNFVRTNNIINLSLTGSGGKNIDIEKFYDVKLSASNSQYASDHSIIPNGPTIAYLPTNYIYTKVDETVVHKVNEFHHTLRLKEENVDDVKLTIINKATGKPLSVAGETEIKLIDYLLMSKLEGMSNQEYLDRRYIWEISFSTANDVAISITINGWRLWFDNTDL